MKSLASAEPAADGSCFDIHDLCDFDVGELLIEAEGERFSHAGREGREGFVERSTGFLALRRVRSVQDLFDRFRAAVFALPLFGGPAGVPDVSCDGKDPGADGLGMAVAFAETEDPQEGSWKRSSAVSTLPLNLVR